MTWAWDVPTHRGAANAVAKTNKKIKIEDRCRIDASTKLCGDVSLEDMLPRFCGVFSAKSTSSNLTLPVAVTDRVFCQSRNQLKGKT
jgi:hypothetical protein